MEVGGKVYTLRPSFNALCEFEDLPGGKTIEALFDDLKGNRPTGLRAVVWCLLQDEHADEIKTLRDASRWIDRFGPDETRALVQSVLELNSPPEGDAKEGEENPPRAQAGTCESSSSEHSKSA